MLAFAGDIRGRRERLNGCTGTRERREMKEGKKGRFSLYSAMCCYCTESRSSPLLFLDGSALLQTERTIASGRGTIGLDHVTLRTSLSLSMQSEKARYLPRSNSLATASSVELYGGNEHGSVFI